MKVTVPLTSLKDIYVDNVIFTLTEKELFNYFRYERDLMTTEGFNLHSWVSYSANLYACAMKIYIHDKVATIRVAMVP